MDKEEVINRDYMKDIFCGKKKTFTVEDIKQINVPNLPELKKETIMELIDGDEQVKQYFKSDYKTGK